MLTLPENGTMAVGKTVSFTGLLGTKLKFDPGHMEVTKTSRMGGIVHDAFTITVEDGDGAKEYVFTTFLSDKRSLAVKKISEAIANTQLEREEDKFDGKG